MIRTLNVIVEDDNIRVSSTGQDYDFVAIIENKTYSPIRIYFGRALDENYIDVGAYDWVGLLANGDDEKYLDLLLAGNYEVDEPSYLS